MISVSFNVDKCLEVVCDQNLQSFSGKLYYLIADFENNSYLCLLDHPEIAYIPYSTKFSRGKTLANLAIDSPMLSHPNIVNTLKCSGKLAQFATKVLFPNT